MSYYVLIFIKIVVTLACPRHLSYYIEIRKIENKRNLLCRLLLVLSFCFFPIPQCKSSFRSSPSATASVDHTLSHKCDFKTRTKTKTTTTTKTTITNTKTRDKITTTTTTTATMSDNFVFDIDAGSGEEATYDAPPRTTPLGTEMLFFFSAEAESGINRRSAYPPASDVEVADAHHTAYIGDGRLADVRRRQLAQQRANAIAASGALGMPAAVSRVTREASELEERVAKMSPVPRVPDLRKKLEEQRAAANSGLHARTAPGGASASASKTPAAGARSMPATASETGDSSLVKKNPEAASGRKKRKGKEASITAPSEASPSAETVPPFAGGDDAAASPAFGSSSVPSADVPSGRKQRRIEKARKRARKAASDRRRRKRNRDALEKV